MSLESAFSLVESFCIIATISVILAEFLEILAPAFSNSAMD